MDLRPTPEQLEIIDSSAAFLRDRLPITTTRELFDAPSNVDDDTWAAAAELGWFALGLPETHGGIGCGLADEALLFREIARSLASGPFLSTVLGARVAAFGGAPTLAESITAGQRVALGVPLSNGALAADVVDGQFHILDSVGASLVLVVSADGAALIEMASLSDVIPHQSFDVATRLSTATAHSVAAVAVVDAATDPICRRGRVLAAAMLTGIIESLLDLAVDHAKTRVQFDKPIGVHQAIKHPCADMAISAQLSYAQTIFAACAIDEQRADAELQALSAHVFASRAAQRASGATIQIHGGMGVTFEHDAHLYLKRAHVLSSLFGGAGASALGQLLAQPSAL